VNKLVRLPAQDCSHFALRRCLYEEHLNPGYDQELRCVVVLHLHGLYDSFLDQAEAFGLGEAQAQDIWERRFQELCRHDTGCQDYKPGANEGFPHCQHGIGDLCVLKLPECAGRCRRFSTHNNRG
jgi:hypothetical protein